MLTTVSPRWFISGVVFYILVGSSFCSTHSISTSTPPLSCSQDIPASPSEQVIAFDGTEGSPTFLSAGERDDELLVVTSENIIFRRCMQNTGCIESRRNFMIAQIDNDDDIAEYTLRGICVLRAKETFLVLVISDTNGATIYRIYECPLAPSSPLSITKGGCSRFALQSNEMDPSGLLYDEDKNIVYVSDKDNNKILILDTNGNFISRLEEDRGDLDAPMVMAIQPGMFAPLSAVVPPSSATSGTVAFSLVLKVRRFCRGLTC